MSETYWESSNRNSKKKCLLIIIHFLFNEYPMLCLQKGMSYISRERPDLKQNPVIVITDPISKPLEKKKNRGKKNLSLSLSHS
jgi:hypothetical protein